MSDFPRRYDPAFLAYVAEVATLLQPLREREVAYGTYHIAAVLFGFDGDPVSDTRIIIGEHGTLEVELGEGESA